MAIKVMITRRFDKSNIIKIIDLMKHIRAKALAKPGYISGETLYGWDDPKKMVVIGTWAGEEDWQAWYQSDERKRIDSELDALLLESAEYEMFGHCSRFLARKGEDVC